MRGNRGQKKGAHYEPQKAVLVLLMQLDIELSSLTVGGVKEVRADWTNKADQLVSDALDRLLSAKSDRVLEYVEPDESLTMERHQHLVKLHGLVGETIMWYSLLPFLEAPTKKGDFDWSMGKEVSSLRKTFGADYALFIYIRHSYATGGRKALAATAVLAGVRVSIGLQVGFATLVDLRDRSVIRRCISLRTHSI